MKAEGKVPAVDTGKCKKCNICIDACPAQAIHESSGYTCAKCVKYCMTMEVPCHPEYIFFEYELCDSCGVCVTACPYDAIAWVPAKRDA